MSDTASTGTDSTDLEVAAPATESPDPVKHGIITDLLARLRLEPTQHHVDTVGQFFDDLVNKPPAKADETAPPESDAAGNKPPAEEDETVSPGSDTMEPASGGEAAEGGTTPPIASGDAVTTPAADNPTETTAAP